METHYENFYPPGLLCQELQPTVTPSWEAIHHHLYCGPLREFGPPPQKRLRNADGLERMEEQSELFPYLEIEHDWAA